MRRVVVRRVRSMIVDCRRGGHHELTDRFSKFALTARPLGFGSPVASTRSDRCPNVTTSQRIAQRFSEILEAKTPIAALRAVTALRRELDGFERQQVARALADGATFASIARELGVSRQAVHRRFRNLSPADAPLVTSPDARRVLLYARDEAIALGADTPTGEQTVPAD